MTQAELNAIVAGITDAAADHIELLLEPLVQRLKAVEQHCGISTATGDAKAAADLFREALRR